MKLVFATHNPNKLRELRALIPEGITLLSLNDIHFDSPIEETEMTLEGNAKIKAQTIYDAHGLPCIADDTGLFVEALEGAPGVHSARYAGESADATANMKKLLISLKDETNRKAYFKTVIAFVHEGIIRYFEGRIDGKITLEPRGTEGFGYDPIFIPIGYEQTFGEMNAVIKNAISHRGRALRSLMEFLKQSQGL